MTPLSRQILEHYQVRKTKKQKETFIRFLQSQLPQLQVETVGFPQNNNLILGDVATAKLLLTAHYDTCARMPVPNFITPLNGFLYVGYQVLIILPFLALMVELLLLLNSLGVPPAVSYWVSYLAMLVGMFGVLMGGPANRHTANDNTSGVITLCELYAAMSEEERKQVAFVFFDNEENGLRGSAAFRRKHKQHADKLLLNFDCVSDGDMLLLAANKRVKARYGDLLEAAFAPRSGKTVRIATGAIYPSDQAGFQLGVGIAALKKHRLVGYYMDRIHTRRDTVFMEENILFLRDSTQALVQKLTSGSAGE